MAGIDLIAAERERQTKLWGDDHDDGHVAGDLSEAAICYAQVALTSVKPSSILAAAPMPDAPASWPWPDWWNPNWGDPVRALVKAGALIAAEIDRLKRGEPQPAHGPLGNPLTTAEVLWVAALDRVPIEERIEWVERMRARVKEINEHRAVLREAGADGA